jgi:hypothetical protein
MREKERERVTVELKMIFCFHTVTQEAKVVRETIPFHLSSKSIASSFQMQLFIPNAMRGNRNRGDQAAFGWITGSAVKTAPLLTEALFRYPNSPLNSTIQKENSSLHQNVGTYMEY